MCETVVVVLSEVRTCGGAGLDVVGTPQRSACRLPHLFIVNKRKFASQFNSLVVNQFITRLTLTARSAYFALARRSLRTEAKCDSKLKPALVFQNGVGWHHNLNTLFDSPFVDKLRKIGRKV